MLIKMIFQYRWLSEIHSDEAAYKIHWKAPVLESLVNKVAGL